MHLWHKLFRVKKIGFPGQIDGEVVEFFTPRHWIVIVPSFVLFILFVSGLIILDFLRLTILPSVGFEWFLLFHCAYLVIITHMFFLKAMNSLMDIMIVTNFRVLRVSSTIFLHRESNVLHMKNIQDIKMFQSGLMPRLLDYGKIVLLSASGEYELEFDYVPHTQKVYSILNHICQKVLQSGENIDTKKANT